MNDKRIIEILEDLCPGEDLVMCNSLVDSRILDSLSIVALVAELEETFDIVIPAVEIVADNFNSVESINLLVSRLIEDQLES